MKVFNKPKSSCIIGCPKTRNYMSKISTFFLKLILWKNQNSNSQFKNFLHCLHCFVWDIAFFSYKFIYFIVLANFFYQLQEERDEVFAKFESTIYDIQQKCGLKSMLLQRKVQVLGEKLEKKVANSNHNLILLIHALNFTIVGHFQTPMEYLRQCSVVQ